MTEVQYKDFEEKDYGDLREMIFCLYEEDPEGEPITEEKIRKTILESQKHPEKIRIVMLKADDQNIGYSILVFFWSNEYGGDSITIDELYVKKEYRNKSIATDFIMRQMTAHENAVSLQIESTPSNSAASGLYKRLGFIDSANDHLIRLL